MNRRNPVVWFGLWMLATVVLSASVIAWQLGHPVELGRPLLRVWKLLFYAPWDAPVWWYAWHEYPEFMRTFWGGVKSAAMIGVVMSMLAMAAVQNWGPMEAVESEEQPERFGTLRDLLESSRFSLRKRGIVLGRSGRKIVYHVGDDHVLLVGASRVAEKGVSVVMPTCADYPHSLIVFDPKGELALATQDERKKLGPTFVFDPTRPLQDHFNPLLELRSGEMNIGDCRALGMLMTVGMEGRDPFWSTKAAELAAAIARLVCTYRPSRRTLAMMRQIALDIAQNRRPTAQDPWAMEIIDEHMSRTSERGVRPGVEAQLLLALATAGDPVAAAATSKSDFTVADICAGPKPVTVYITLPPSQHESLRHMARIVLQAFMHGMLHDPAKASDGRPKRRPVLALIDEFPQLGHMPFIENGLAVAAGYGLRVLLVTQSLEQIAATYGPQQSILGNIGTLLWVPSLSRGSYEQVTAAAGTIVATMRARHRKVGVINQRPSETVSQSRVPVINPREAQLYGADHIMVVPPHGVPVWVQKARFYELGHYRGRIRDVRPEHAPRMKDTRKQIWLRVDPVLYDRLNDKRGGVAMAKFCEALLEAAVSGDRQSSFNLTPAAPKAAAATSVQIDVGPLLGAHMDGVQELQEVLRGVYQAGEHLRLLRRDEATYREARDQSVRLTAKWIADHDNREIDDDDASVSGAGKQAQADDAGEGESDAAQGANGGAQAAAAGTPRARGPVAQDASHVDRQSWLGRALHAVFG